MARWVSKVASLTVTQWLAKISVEYNMKLEFTKKNEVFLTGSLWVESLESRNKEKRMATLNDITDSIFETSTFKL